jgi:hypothetical protein
MKKVQESPLPPDAQLGDRFPAAVTRPLFAWPRTLQEPRGSSA